VGHRKVADEMLIIRTAIVVNFSDNKYVSEISPLAITKSSNFCGLNLESLGEMVSTKRLKSAVG
jgi:hypothetical protein